MMEVSCPQCTQRLRYSDKLVNPLLRCRNCLTTFRPVGNLTAAEEPVAAIGVDEYDEALPTWTPDRSLQPEPETSTTGRVGKSKAGYATIVILLIAFKAGPRLLRELFREPKPKQPVQFQPANQQAIQEMLDAAKNAENAGNRPRFPPLPMPDHNHRIKPRTP
jgi:hypothetical protein